jgi:hypothetical protein
MQSPLVVWLARKRLNRAGAPARSRRVYFFA